MLFIAHWLVILVFWIYVLRLARLDGYGIPALAALFWFAGYFAIPAIGLEGGLYFISYGAILSLLLIMLDLSREKMGLRKPRIDPLDEEKATESKTQ